MGSGASTHAEGTPPKPKEEKPKPKYVVEADKRMKALFDEIDVDKSGKVSRQELLVKLKHDPQLENMLMISHEDKDQAELDGKQHSHLAVAIAQIELLDADGDHSLDPKEFGKLFMLAVCKDRTRKLFDSMDVDHTGAVDRYELIEKLKVDADLESFLDLHDTELEVFGGCNEELLDALAAAEALDTNTDGRITWPEFDAATVLKATKHTLADLEKEEDNAEALVGGIEAAAAPPVSEPSKAEAAAPAAEAAAPAAEA